MANYLSPRVVINEVDNSILVNSFAGGPMLILGETPEGPDDNVYTIINLSQYSSYFGTVEGNYPAMFGAKEYLAYGNDLKFKRVTSVKSVKFASDVSVTLTETETISGVTGSTIRVPSGTATTPYLDDSSVDTVVYLNNDTAFYKVYITEYIGNDGTDEVYSIVWDSYGYTYTTTALTADLYIGHAEPAYTTELKFPIADAAAASATLTFTNSGESFDAVSYYVTTYSNASAIYGSTTEPVLAMTVETSATDLATGTYTYRYSFKTALGVESPVSVPASATVDATGEGIEITLPELPTGFSSYVIYRDLDGGGFFNIIETSNRVVTHNASNDTDGDPLAQCPITLNVNGVSIYTELSGITHDVFYNACDGRSILGEYKFEYVYTEAASSTQIFTLIAGTSPTIEVGDVWYIMEPITFSVTELPNDGTYVEGTVNTSVRGQYLTSSFLGTVDKFLYFNGTGTVTIPSTASINAYYLLGDTKVYYTNYASGFTYYKATCKGRGTYGNELLLLTTYNSNNAEWGLYVYGTNGLLEVWSGSDLDEMVTIINETSTRITLEVLTTTPALTGFVPYDETYSNDFVKYFLADPAYGHDGYFDVSVNDFVANIDPYVATSLSNFDADLADLVTTANLIASTESTLSYDLMVIPGWSSHQILANAMYGVVTTKKQFVSCILDMPSGLTPIMAAIYRAGIFNSIDNSHAAIFWNYAKIYDSVNRQYVWLPPSVFVIRAIAYTEQTITPFAAAAGLKRGLLPNVVALEYNPNLSERDLLYSAQVNPLATISGIVTVWGNKTSQRINSMLSDFNVRRMLDKAERAVYTASQSLLFDPNDAAERQAIILSIQPIFDVIAQKRGITEFTIVDSTTEEDVSWGIARFTINLRPTATIRIIEYDIIINKANLG